MMETMEDLNMEECLLKDGAKCLNVEADVDESESDSDAGVRYASQNYSTSTLNAPFLRRAPAEPRTA